MVLFSNINANQRVELRYKHEILRGTVKYKGPVVSLDGDWVGVALDEPCKFSVSSMCFVWCLTSDVADGITIFMRELRVLLSFYSGAWS